jgi:DNA-directed RNA polymerase beta subunit
VSDPKDILGFVQLINPFTGNNDGSRSTMIGSHINQLVPLCKGEIPRVLTPYSRLFISSISDLYYKESDSNYSFIGEYKLFGESLFLFKDNINKKIVFCYKEHNLEGFCSKTTPNTSDDIKSGEPLYRTQEISEDGLPSFGINANVCYMVAGENFEDAFIISESFAKKISHNEIDEIELIVNDNEFLMELPFYNGKTLPGIGEEVDPGSRIVAVKKVINKNFISSLSIKNINWEKDDIYYSKGKVISIDVISNKEEVKPRHKELDEYSKQTQENIRKFVLDLEKFVKDGYELDEILNGKLNHYITLISGKTAKYDEKEFSGYLVKIRVLRENIAATLGSKITSLHASKGLASTRILPDHEMPTTENGEVADIIFNPNSVIGRQNLGQIHEVMVNTIAQEVYKKICATDSIEEKTSIYKDFFDRILKNENYRNFIYSVLDNNPKQFFEKLEEQGYLVSVVEPLKQPTREDYKYFKDKYNIKFEKKVTFKGESVINPVLFGKLYVIKLQHEPIKKTSYTSINYYNSGGPTKTSAKSKYKATNTFNPSVIGEMELSSLLVDPNYEIIKELIYTKSSNRLLSEYLSTMRLYNKKYKNYDEFMEEIQNSDEEINAEYLKRHLGINLLKHYLRCLYLDFFK